MNIDALLDALLNDVRVDAVRAKIGDTPSLILHPASADLHFIKHQARHRIRQFVIASIREALKAA